MATAQILDLAPGDALTLVRYERGRALKAAVTVRGVSPLELHSESPGLGDASPGSPVLLLRVEKTECFMSESMLGEVHPEGRGWVAGVVAGPWEATDRRQYPRLPIETTIKVRALDEHDGELGFREMIGTTIDLSLGGCQARFADNPDNGALVDVRLPIDEGEPIRALGIVVRTIEETPAVGIHFLDYIGGSRTRLHEFLARKS